MIHAPDLVLEAKHQVPVWIYDVLEAKLLIGECIIEVLALVAVLMVIEDKILLSDGIITLGELCHVERDVPPGVLLCGFNSGHCINDLVERQQGARTHHDVAPNEVLEQPPLAPLRVADSLGAHNRSVEHFDVFARSRSARELYACYTRVYLGPRERIGFPDDKLVAPWAGDFYVRRQNLVCRAAQGLYLAAAEVSAGQLGGNRALRKHGRELIKMRKIQMDAPLKDLSYRIVDDVKLLPAYVVPNYVVARQLRLLARVLAAVLKVAAVVHVVDGEPQAFVVEPRRHRRVRHVQVYVLHVYHVTHVLTSWRALPPILSGRVLSHLCSVVGIVGIVGMVCIVVIVVIVVVVVIVVIVSEVLVGEFTTQAVKLTAASSSPRFLTSTAPCRDGTFHCSI
mmetsp:Transcript_22844/g.38195  ORF Transcript_22844/g.38195 Transcript_22844/m.38195 type:complete len:396 (+) Transcript_22844:380-1567(+)